MNLLRILLCTCAALAASGCAMPAAREALHSAIRSGDAEALAELSPSKRLANARYRGGDTPLTYATRLGATNSIMRLVEARADVDRPNGDGDRPLHVAAEETPATIAILVAYGADVDATNERGRSPLQEAARAGNVDALNALLKAGADLSFEDARGQTALHHGTRSARATSRLLKAGADPNASSEQAEGAPSPLQVAKSHLHQWQRIRTTPGTGYSRDAIDRRIRESWEVIDLLRSHGAVATP